MSDPQRVGDALTRWLARVDTCTRCDNTQPPRAAIPLTGRPPRFAASYECADCGLEWSRTYFTREEL